jgi:hypothetical protein
LLISLLLLVKLLGVFFLVLVLGDGDPKDLIKFINDFDGDDSNLTGLISSLAFCRLIGVFRLGFVTVATYSVGFGISIIP